MFIAPSAPPHVAWWGHMLKCPRLHSVLYEGPAAALCLQSVLVMSLEETLASWLPPPSCAAREGQGRDQVRVSALDSQA